MLSSRKNSQKFMARIPKRSTTFFLLLALLTLFVAPPCEGAYTLSGGRLVNKKFLATMSVEAHYQEVEKGIEEKEWEVANLNCQILIENFSTHDLAKEALFYAGISSFELGELGRANSYLTRYLRLPGSVHRFEEALEAKFLIAERYREGARKRLFGVDHMPKWLTAKEDALEIYEELIAALPTLDLAARSMISKAELLYLMREYSDAADSYQGLLLRFPHYSEMPKCYVNLIRCYRKEGEPERQNPDYLAMAGVILRRFKEEYPRHTGITEAEKEFLAMKESYASGLYDTGRFFERIKRPESSIIYYASIVEQFPETEIATSSRERLQKLKKYVEVTDLPQRLIQ